MPSGWTATFDTTTIASLAAGSEIRSIVGNELTGGNPVPADPTQDGTVFPEGIGHWNAWPLSQFPTNRRNGAPQDEFVTPGTIIDRLRGMDSLAAIGKRPDNATIVDWLTAIGIGNATGDDEVVMLNHPRAGFADRRQRVIDLLLDLVCGQTEFISKLR